MKELLLLTLFCGLATGLPMVLFPCEVEEYGQAVVQFDVKTGAYFIDVVRRYEIEPTSETKVGMPVSYLKNKGVDYRISSNLQTKEEMINESRKESRRGCLFVGVIFWCIGALVFLFNKRRRAV